LSLNSNQITEKELAPNEEKNKQVGMAVKKKKKSSSNQTQSKSIKQWLKKNSLTSLKLTILDALEPYIVQTKSDDFRVLEDYVDSKPWSDVSN
jgi:hypothetical protein